MNGLISAPDFEWLKIDASHVKAHPDAAGACGGNQAMGVTKGGSIATSCNWPSMHKNPLNFGVNEA